MMYIRVKEWEAIDIIVDKSKTIQINSTNTMAAKYTVKDSVFSDLFMIKKYLLQMYQTLHPEDQDATEDDLSYVTIENVLINDIYNDLGIMRGDRTIILVEAQSTWTMNIIIRALLYLAKTYQEYINVNELDVYSKTNVHLPKPELYVLFTGEHKEHPEIVTLSSDFFGEKTDLEVTVHMLYGQENGKDIISQYVAFTKVYDEQRGIYGRTREAIEKTIRICKDNDILKEYLESREKEVVDIMMTLFDEETIRRNHEASIIRETKQEEQQRGIKAVVEAFKQMGGSITDAIENVMANYGYDHDTSDEYVRKYW